MKKSSRKYRIGFIGLGLMGAPMARNIHSAGYPLAVYNRSREKTRKFADLGVPVYDSPSSLARKSDVIISMVTGPQDVKEIYLGKKGVAATAKKGLICIDMSTIGPTAAKEVAAALSKKGIDFIDAPVTGSTWLAKTGELIIFAGGNKKIFDKIKPVLSVLGNTIHYIGSTGSGQAIKLVNNVIGASSFVLLAEGILLSEELGIPNRKIEEVLVTLHALSPFMKVKLPKMIHNDFSVQFSLANMRKDVSLAADEVKDHAPLKMYLASLRAFYDRGVEQGLGKKDVSAVIEVLKRGAL